MKKRGNLIEHMNFNELWVFLKNQNRNKFLYVCKEAMKEALEMEDATLRYRKRKLKFNNLERREIHRILIEYTGNQNLKEEILFPNCQTKYLKEFYSQKQKLYEK